MIEQCEADPNIANSNGSECITLCSTNNKKDTKLIELLLTNMSLTSINKKNGTGDTLPWTGHIYDDKSPIKQKIIDLIRSKGGKREE